MAQPRRWPMEAFPFRHSARRERLASKKDFPSVSGWFMLATHPHEKIRLSGWHDGAGSAVGPDWHSAGAQAPPPLSILFRLHALFSFCGHSPCDCDHQIPCSLL